MPILEIEIVLKPDETIQNEMVTALADQLGEIFKSPNGGTWVKVYELAEHHYAENGREEQKVYPVFLTILKSKLPPLEEMQMEVEKITSAVAQVCGRPREEVHVIYEPEGSGRAAFGGKIVT
jgi:phenylpyruvate tautomerase PptA (4-oxalocrotonate tautomerase family)